MLAQEVDILVIAQLIAAGVAVFGLLITSGVFVFHAGRVKGRFEDHARRIELLEQEGSRFRKGIYERLGNLEVTIAALVKTEKGE